MAVRFQRDMADLPQSDAAADRADSLAELAHEAASCQRCPLYRNATQTVFGEGPPRARVMLVGEQPGDREDRAGHPFVGPAGRLLDQALERAGFTRADLYVTNAVKHFKWTPAGGRRLHAKPNAREIAACKYWLERELVLVDPEFIVALGATAAQALLGRDFRVTRSRGQVFTYGADNRRVVATVHPSSILRGPVDQRRAALVLFVRDLRQARKLLASPGKGREYRATGKIEEPWTAPGFLKGMPTKPTSRPPARTASTRTRPPRETLAGSKAKAAREKAKLHETRDRIDDGATTEDTSVRSGLF